MDALPEELVALICQQCDHSSLKNARLVSKRFKACSSPGVFEHFYMGLFGYGLDKLAHIARSPLSKHVQKFTIFSDILPEWTQHAHRKAIDFRPPFGEWLASCRKAHQFPLTGLPARDKLDYDPREAYERLPQHHFSKDQLDEAYDRYRDMVREQVSWREDNLGLPFREFFSSLPNLSEAEVKCTTAFGGRTNTQPVWKALRERIFVGPDDWIYSTDFHEFHYADMSGQAALSLLEAIAYRSSFAGTKPITTLRMHSSHIDPYKDLMSPDGMHLLREERFNRILEGFNGLTTLHIHVPHATASARITGPGMAEETMLILRAASQLETLELRYGDDELSPDDEGSQLENLFNNDAAIWPKLKSLALATNVSAKILVKFLTLHRETIKSLELKDMLIHDVEHALEQIPKILSLEHVYAECLWDDAESVGENRVTYLSVLSHGTDAPAAKHVKEYLLRQSETMPALERDGGLGDITIDLDGDQLSDDSSDETDNEE